MDAKILETTLKAHLSEMRQRLDQASGIAKTAGACAEIIEKAIEIALDVEQLIYEAFLNAASLMHRIYRT